MPNRKRRQGFLRLAPKASSSIVEEHNRLAKKGEASIGPIQQWAINLLSNPDIPSPADASQASEALSIGRSNLVRTELGAIRNTMKEEQITATVAAQKIVEVVQNYGLRKVKKPTPLKEITEDDIGVVCWMAILPPVSTPIS